VVTVKQVSNNFNTHVYAFTVSVELL